MAHPTQPGAALAGAAPGDAVSAAAAAVAGVTPVTTLSDGEGRIDMAALRRYRLGRVRQRLKAEDAAGALLVDPINIRYASGSRNYSMFQMHTPSRYLFVATEGPVVLFDAPACHHVARAIETIDEVRPAASINFFFAGDRLAESVERWAAEIADLVARHGGGNRRLAVDRCDPAWAAALVRRGVALVDGQCALERARAIKSAEEILCMNATLGVADIAIARMREALRPGLTENQLWAVLHHTNISMGGEWIDARLLSAGDRTNPWFQESSDRMIRPGELVAFDVDMVGPFGYCADVSRTFHCGPGRPGAEQRRLYAMAYEDLHHNLALVRPGVSFRELAEKAYRHAEEFAPNRYMLVAHGIGLCDEYPSIFHRQDYAAGAGYDGHIEANMTLCVESYIGAVGGREGVKLEQQILVTDTGYALLSRFPFEDALLG
jgi:Xaa-Pro aminopeptidase